ncbi:protein MON2 homolog isoform X1 [Drosophila subobscura]|uniref:protein MON2 homolog isoform X1 n=1 Tax=Drosophila subobscura TaxID=7241 RepID=UPI00155A7210|nr:protein MON2 homolog isoform X1 [Drosophila subobscura]
MSFVGGGGGQDVHKFVEALQADFKTLSLETKKKYPQIKEACEEAISKLCTAGSSQQNSVYYTVNQILYPLVQGCETKDLKIIKFCLGMMQRLITQQVVDQKGALYITNALWTLMENNIEEVKVLQTVTLLLTTNTVVHGDTLAKALVLCFRLHYTKNPTIVNTAGATIRQLVSLVFERVYLEKDSVPSLQQQQQQPNSSSNSPVEAEGGAAAAGQDVQTFASDAFLLFQDLVQLVNAEQPYWLVGMTEMTRTFGLELLEAVLTNFSAVFHESNDFRLLLKERVCALVIKLFSPNVKHRQLPAANNGTAPVPAEKPYFPISMRLLRLVAILIQKYHTILVTECEIFLSLIIKFLDPDKPAWQRALAVEVIHKLVTRSSLIAFFCKSYDLKNHATNIVHDMIAAMGSFVRYSLINASVMLNGQQNGGVLGVQPTSSLSTLSGNNQCGFSFRGAYLPLVATYAPGVSKAVYLEMLDKLDAPNIPDSYGISVGHAILLDMTRSIGGVIQRTPELHPTHNTAIITEEEHQPLCLQLVNSSWSGLLSAFIPLVETSMDEATTENILKAMQNYAALCGMLEQLQPRDAFIMAMCRASFPPHYAMSIFANATQTDGDVRCHTRSGSQDLSSQFLNNCTPDDFRPQIVAVGTPLPSASLPHSVMQAPVMLTNKNLQCMRAILFLAHNNGGILGTSWHMVLQTLQHLVWILGLKPSTGGSLQAMPKPAVEANVGIQTAVMADLPVLSQMLSQLFESSQYLDDVALHHLIDALCKLSHEAMELAYANREPSLFAVAKLLETGLVNMPRINVLWRPLTNHLLEVCQHRHIRMREWGVEAITYLVKSALQFKHKTPLKENMELQTMLLSPLSELSTVLHADVRQRQLDCVLQILNTAGEILSFGWPAIIEIIGAVNEHHGEPLIRTAFQCLQLVITDFLTVMPWRCLPLCISTAAKFGSQTQELNISLTAIGLMWNISDFFNQNQDKLMSTQLQDVAILPEFPGTVKMPQFDKLWMCLYAKLGELCVDLRPAVRKSAGQTLFSTISAHGSLLNPPTWQALVWQVLFPLLDNVRALSSSASNEKVDASGNILIHHSRNTAQKQWAETQVLTLSGVCRVFNTKRELLQMLGDFERAWSLILEFIQNAALSKNGEVSLAALKSLQEIMYHNTTTERGGGSSLKDPQSAQEQDEEIWTYLKSIEKQFSNFRVNHMELFFIAWNIWLSIGMESTKMSTTKAQPQQPSSNGGSNGSQDSQEDFYIPSQAFLTALIQIFPAIFHHIQAKFSSTDFDKFCTVLTNAVCIPVQTDAVPYIMSTVSDTLLTPLHDGILDCMELIQKEATKSDSNISQLIPAIFRQLLIFSKFACAPPTFQQNVEHKYAKSASGHYANNASVEVVSMNYIPFGEKSISICVKLYQTTATEDSVVHEQILHDIVKAVRTPLAMKYKCLSSSTWKLAISSLISVLHTGLKVARAKPQHFASLWDDLADTLDKFLFPASVCTIEDRGLEEIVLDETIDCHVIELLRDEVLPHAHEMPHQFIMQIVVLLNKGSIHSASDTNICYESDWKLREIFAKTCFETLLQFSLLEDHHATNNNRFNANLLPAGAAGAGGKDFAGRLAVTALLHRFQEVLKRFNDDERQSGKCPLPRFRLSEISFVLKAIATLVVSMKKAPASKVNKPAWDQLIGLYPYLVDCTTTTSPEVSRSLREALLQYTDLLQAPRLCGATTNDNSIQSNGQE